MYYASYHKPVQDEYGNLLDGASITVVDESTGLPAILYEDRAGTLNAGNPVYSVAGQVLFFVQGGAYRITVAKDTFSQVYRYIAIGTAQELDIEDIVDFMS